jgi:hypothetical protein
MEENNKFHFKFILSPSICFFFVNLCVNKLFNNKEITMKHLFLFFLPFLVACNTENTSNNGENVNIIETKQESSMNEQLLRHVVLIKFNEEATPEDISEVVEAFGSLQDKIPEIKDYEWGINNSPEGINKGFTHCFLVTFESEEDREVYLPHPDHKAFVEVLSPHMEDVLVVDYWAK